MAVFCKFSRLVIAQWHCYVLIKVLNINYKYIELPIKVELETMENGGNFKFLKQNFGFRLRF